MITLILINNQPAFLKTGNFDRTVFLYLAYFAPPALFRIKLRYTLSDNPQVIQIRLYTIVGTSAYCYLKFMRQLYRCITMENLS